MRPKTGDLGPKRTRIPDFDRLVLDATADNLGTVWRELDRGNGAKHASRVRVLLLLDQCQGTCGQEKEC